MIVVRLILGMLFIINTMGFTFTFSDMYTKVNTNELLRSVLALIAFNILADAVLFTVFY